MFWLTVCFVPKASVLLPGEPTSRTGAEKQKITKRQILQKIQKLKAKEASRSFSKNLVTSYLKLLKKHLYNVFGIFSSMWLYLIFFSNFTYKRIYLHRDLLSWVLSGSANGSVWLRLTLLSTWFGNPVNLPMICQIMYIHSLCIDPPPKHLPTAVHPMSYNVSQNYHESKMEIFF